LCIQAFREQAGRPRRRLGGAEESPGSRGQGAW